MTANFARLTHRSFTIVNGLTLAAILALAAPVAAQRASRSDSAKAFERQVYACFDRGDYREALQIIEIDARDAANKRVTARNDLFVDRRPELYGRLVRRVRQRA